ncbi:phage minor tail protein L [Escherichia coli]|uniref:phage minor tail protein L n=1 Tax=Escherichia coli TaxID=562 RepID=UPI003D7C2B03
MQDIRQETLNECTRAEQSASVVLWEIDLTAVGGDRYFFCNEQNEKGEPVTWQGRQYQAYPIQGSGFEMNGKGASARPTLKVSNLYGMVTGMAEDLQSLVGGTVVRRKVYARFLDAVNFVNGNRDADPEQEVISRWRIEQCSELSAVSASFVLSTPTETDGAVFPGRIMLANTCTWTYRGDECGYPGTYMFSVTTTAVRYLQEVSGSTLTPQRAGNWIALGETAANSATLFQRIR